MNPLLSWASDALTQTAPPDTVLFFAAAESLDRWADIATIALTVLFVVLVLVAVASVVQLRRLVVRSTRLLEDIRQYVDPVGERAKIVADNLGYVSAMVREDVERLSSTVAGLTGRLNRASDRVEERIEEFNVLLKVAQNEAEDLFIDTASTVRAVRAGARSLSRGPETPVEDEEGGP